MDIEEVARGRGRGSFFSFPLLINIFVKTKSFSLMFVLPQHIYEALFMNELRKDISDIVE